MFSKGLMQRASTFIFRSFRSKAIHKVDIPAFDWPIAQFPRYKYPLAKHEQHNRREDEASLADVRRLIDVRRKEKRDVAALIVEPIQSEGGDFHASAEYFKVSGWIIFLWDFISKSCDEICSLILGTSNHLQGKRSHVHRGRGPNRRWCERTFLGTRKVGPGRAPGHGDLLQKGPDRGILLP